MEIPRNVVEIPAQWKSRLANPVLVVIILAIMSHSCIYYCPLEREEICPGQ